MAKCPHCGQQQMSFFQNIRHTKVNRDKIKNLGSRSLRLGGIRQNTAGEVDYEKTICFLQVQIT